MEALLGDKLRNQGEDVATTEVLAGAEVVALYFSASWCGPCRSFTPVLMEKYQELKTAGKGFEVVFVSSDKDADQFGEYYGKMPWLALPFEARDIKKKLSRKYKVQGIPTLVMLSADGSLITKDGRSEIADISKFPWPVKPLSEALGATFLDKENSEVSLQSWRDAGSYIGLYFSAHWCPPCQAFTPELVKAYNNVRAAGKKFELVFVSSDRDKGEFAEYRGTMPWHVVPLEDRERKDALAKHFEVQGIPHLVILDSNLNVVNGNARGAVGGDTAGEGFPWAPKPVREADEDPEGIEDYPVVFVCMEAAADEWDGVEKALNEVAEGVKAGLKDEDEMPYLFMVAKETGGIGGQIRRLCGLGRRPGPKPEVVLLDLSDDGAYYHPKEQGDVTAASVSALLASYKAGELEKKVVKQ